jgi:hypothetical protein
VDLGLSDDLIWTGTLDLEVIGDFNAIGEVLEVTIEDSSGSETAVLFDNDYTNDEWFDGEETGPTNGTANPLIGAQSSQGNVTINGHQGGSNLNPFTEDDIDTIINDTAVFTSNASVTLSGDLGQFYGDAIITHSITEYPLSESGVDFAQIEMVLTATGDWFGDRAISNVVFYLDCGDEDLIKVKIDNWSDLEQEYTSTGQFDFSAEAINALLAEEFEFEEDCDFVGMTIKAGNNFEEGFERNQTMGEGEIVFGDIDGDYGKLNKFDYVVEATDVIDDFLMA